MRNFNWRNVGVVLLVWLVITGFGIVETIQGSQFHDAGFSKIVDAKVINYLVSASTCNNGASSCYNAYAIVGYGQNFAQECQIINFKGASNGTTALLETESDYPLNTILTVYRRKGTRDCQTSSRSDTGAIIGVVLLCFSGCVLLSLPITGRYLLDVVVAEDGGGGKVQAVELLSLTPKEVVAMKKGRSIAMARKASMRASRENNKKLSERFTRHLVEMQRLENAEAQANSEADNWDSISPSKFTQV
jgi:hypothetical protein